MKVLNIVYIIVGLSTPIVCATRQHKATASPQKQRAIVSSKPSNVLAKAVHHRGTEVGLELGQVALCFVNKPVYEELPETREGDHYTRGFYFPGVTIASDVLTKFNRTHTDKHYQVMLKQVKAGVKLIVSYDATKVSMNLNSCPRPFVCIDTQKGLCISFYNKPLLKKLNDYNEKMLRTASLDTKPVIVIDPGHGGSDCGAKSCSNDFEKDIALNVGLKVAKLLKKNTSCDVFLTRDSDTTLALDERTTYANRCNADLFISIHANHAGKDSVCGIETFCLDDGFCKYAVSGPESNYAKTVQAFRHDVTKHSICLAECLHRTTLASVKKHYADVGNRKVKQAVAQVLMGTSMPSALIELGFLSNKIEAELLKSEHYQQLLAHGICDGVMAYLSTVKMV